MYCSLSSFIQYTKTIEARNMSDHDITTQHFSYQANLLACGFEQATHSSIPKEIWNIHPHGGTAMRDAIIYGNNLMMKLHKLIQTDHTGDSWTFIHIVITDGDDTDSVCSVKRTVHMIKATCNDLALRDFNIIILGVEIEDYYAKSIRKLIEAVGTHGQYHDISHMDLHEIFHRIREDAGIHNRTPTLNNAESSPQVDKYAVLFTLDISGSMHGKKWDMTCHATVDFIRHLESKDAVSAIIFNQTPHLATHWSPKQNQYRLKKEKPRVQLQVKKEGTQSQLNAIGKMTKQETEISDPMLNSNAPQRGRKYLLDTTNQPKRERRTGCFCCF